MPPENSLAECGENGIVMARYDSTERWIGRHLCAAHCAYVKVSLASQLSSTSDPTLMLVRTRDSEVRVSSPCSVANERGMVPDRHVTYTFSKGNLMLCKRLRTYMWEACVIPPLSTDDACCCRIYSDRRGFNYNPGIYFHHDLQFNCLKHKWIPSSSMHMSDPSGQNLTLKYCVDTLKDCWREVFWLLRTSFTLIEPSLIHHATHPVH